MDAVAAEPPSPSPAISLTAGVHKTILENGLTVLIKEVQTVPVVSVQVWYRVGSRNESPGSNGISHLLEHLMFKGTQLRPIQFGRLFSALGSSFNAFTSYDVTAYFGTVSPQKLEALLTLEADRMLNTVIEPEQLSSEKRVVVSELQGYENSPGYRLSRAMMQAAFPGSPYGLPVGGNKTDVEGFSLEAVLEHYRQYYCPENAVLVVTGNVEATQSLSSVKNTFGQIPRRAPSPSTPPAADASTFSLPVAQTEPIRLQEPGSAPFLEILYPLPTALHPDAAALEVMDAILSAGRSSRLYQALVETGLASSAGSYAALLTGGGWYNLSAIAAPGQDLGEITGVIDETIAQLHAEPVSEAELQRAGTQLRANFVLRNRDVDNQASQLAYDEIVAGDYQFSDRHLQALATVTAADVQRVARQYLSPAQRTLGLFEPTQLAAGMGPGMGMQTSEDFSPGEPVDPAEVARYLPLLPQGTETAAQALPKLFTLAPGLRVLLLVDRSTPTVTLAGQVAAGSGFDTSARAGLASLVADNLLSGTIRKDALTLAQILEDRGLHLDFSAHREGVDISGYALSDELPLLLQILGEVLQESNFPEREVELTRQQTLSSLQIELDDPGRVGRRVLQQTLYPPEHPFYSFPSAETLQGITREAMVDFFQRHYGPQQTVLTLVGNFDPEAIQTQLTEIFGQWTSPAEVPAWSIPRVTLPASAQTLNPTIPGKAQVITYLGHPGIERRHPLFYAATVLNQALGGDTLSSRLGTEIRDRQGLTYGIYSYFAAGQLAGPFLVQMQTGPEDTQRAITSVVALLTQLRAEGLRAEELATAQRTLINSYPVELANLDTLCRTLLNNEVLGLPLTEVRSFPEKIAAVTPEQIQEVLQTLIHPENLVIVSAGPKIE